MRLKTLLKCAGLIAACGISSNAAQFSEWADFRGPTGQGHAPNATPPIHWNTSSNVVWKIEVPGSAWSSPTLHRDRLFVTTAIINDGKPTSLRLLSYSADSGDLIWDRELFQPADVPGIHRKNSQASPTPIGEDGRIYAHFGHLGTACVDFEGNVLWRQTELTFEPIHGNGGSPVIVDDKLIFSCDGNRDPYLAALDKNSGEVLWRTPRETGASKKFSFATPLLITVDGQRQLISPCSGAVIAYAPETGGEIWRVDYDQGYSVVPKPLYGHGLLYVGTGFNQARVLAIRPGGTGDLTESNLVWESKRGAPHTPSMLLVGDELYFVSDGGIASCVDAKTGESHWQERLGGDCSASPILADGKIFFTLENGKTVVLEAGKEFKVLAENDLEERTFASPIAVGETLFIRTEGHLYRIE